MDPFLHLLIDLFGEDHELTAAYRDAEPATDEQIDVEGLTASGLSEDEIAALRATYNLDGDTLSDIREGLREAAMREGDDAIDLDTLSAVADAIDGVSFLIDLRDEVAQDEAARRAEVLARIAADDEPTDSTDEGDDGTGDDGDEGGDGDPEGGEGDDGPEGAQADAEDPELVLAGGTPARPRISNVAARRHLTAGGNRPRSAGDASPRFQLNFDLNRQHRFGDDVDEDVVAEAFVARLKDISGTWDGTTQKLKIAALQHDFPEARHLRIGKDEANSEKVRAALESAREASVAAYQSGGPGAAIESLTASGGLCAPLMPYYPQAELGDDGRPVRGFLPGFRMDRGGIVFVPPASFAAGDFDGGSTVWTDTNDADPGSDGPETKPFLRIECDDQVTVKLYAVTEGVEVGNFVDRTYPERVRTFVNGARMVHARMAERKLIQGIHALSVAPAAFPQRYGASIDLLGNAELAATMLRESFRVSENFVLDYLLPVKALAMMRSDIMSQLPGTGTVDEKFALADERIAAFFRSRNIRLGFFRDNQQFSLAGTGDSIAWPETITGYMHPAGHFLFGDGGEMNLGIFRDKSMIETNDFAIFSETFEAVAGVGVPGSAIRVVNTVCVDGSVAGAIDPICTTSTPVS